MFDGAWMAALSVLTFTDGFVIFTVTDDKGRMFLGYPYDNSGTVGTYLVVPVDRELLFELESGRVTVLDVLSRRPAWLLYHDNADSSAHNVWRELDSLSQLNADWLPKPGVTLRR